MFSLLVSVLSVKFSIKLVIKTKTSVSLLTSTSVNVFVEVVFKPSLKVITALSPFVKYKSNISSVLFKEGPLAKFGFDVIGLKPGYVKVLIPTLRVPTPLPVTAAADLPSAEISIRSIPSTLTFCQQA